MKHFIRNSAPEIGQYSLQYIDHSYVHVTHSTVNRATSGASEYASADDIVTSPPHDNARSQIAVKVHLRLHYSLNVGRTLTDNCIK